MEVVWIMSIDVYEQIPVMESDKFLLREIKDSDVKDLLKVYSDVKSVPIFNSDNCVGDFYIKTIQDLNRMIDFIIPETKEMFDCEMIATKAISIAKERIAVLEKMGFCLSEEVLVGCDGTKYDSYYVREV